MKPFARRLIEPRTDDNLDTANRKHLAKCLLNLIGTLAHTYDCFAGKNKGDGQAYIDEHGNWEFFVKFISHRAEVMAKYKPQQTILDSGKQVVFILNSFRQGCKFALDNCEGDEACTYLLAHNRNGMDALAEFDIHDDRKKESVYLKEEVNNHCYRVWKKDDHATAPSSTVGPDNSPHAQHPADDQGAVVGTTGHGVEEVKGLLRGGGKKKKDKGKKGTTTVKVQQKSMADVAGTVTTVRDVTQKLGYGPHHNKCIQESHVDNITKMLTSALLVCAKVLLVFLAGQGSVIPVIAAGLYAAFILIDLALTAFTDERVSPRGSKLLLFGAGKLVTLTIVFSADADDADAIMSTDVTVETDDDTVDETTVTADPSATEPGVIDLGLDAAATQVAVEGVAVKGVVAEEMIMDTGVGSTNVTNLDQGGQTVTRVAPSGKGNVLSGNRNVLSGNYDVHEKVSSSGDSNVLSGYAGELVKSSSDSPLEPNQISWAELQKTGSSDVQEDMSAAGLKTSGKTISSSGDTGLRSLLSSVDPTKRMASRADALEFVGSQQSGAELTPELSGKALTSGLRNVVSGIKSGPSDVVPGDMSAIEPQQSNWSSLGDTGAGVDSAIGSVTEAVEDGAAAHGHGGEGELETVYLEDTKHLKEKATLAEGTTDQGVKVKEKLTNVLDFFRGQKGGEEDDYTRLLNMKATLLERFKVYGLPTDDESIYEGILQIAKGGRKALNKFDMTQKSGLPSRSALTAPLTTCVSDVKDLFNESDSFYFQQFEFSSLCTALDGTDFNRLKSLTSVFLPEQSSGIMGKIKTLSKLAKSKIKKEGGNMRRNGVKTKKKTKNRTKNRRNIRKTIRKTIRK